MGKTSNNSVGSIEAYLNSLNKTSNFYNANNNTNTTTSKSFSIPTAGIPTLPAYNKPITLEGLLGKSSDLPKPSAVNSVTDKPGLLDSTTDYLKSLWDKTDFSSANKSTANRGIFDGVYKNDKGEYMDTNFFTKDKKAGIRDLDFNQAKDAGLVKTADEYKKAGGGADILSSMDYLNGALNIGQLGLGAYGTLKQIDAMDENIKASKQVRETNNKESVFRDRARKAINDAFSNVG